MNSNDVKTGMLMDEHTRVSFVEVCKTCHISEDFLIELVEHGLVKMTIKNIEQQTFDYHTICRIQSAKRLQHDLDVNTAGVVLALELLDELKHVREELAILQRHVGQTS